MDYATLRAEHDSLRQQFLAGDLTPAELVAMAVVVRARAAELPSADRERVENELDALERLANYTAAPPSASGDAASDGLVDQAGEVSRLARQPGGSAAERVARAEAGIAKIRQLAEAADSPGQRRAVLRNAEVLARLASALRDDDSGSGQ
jgi:hypothetical protein